MIYKITDKKMEPWGDRRSMNPIGVPRNLAVYKVEISFNPNDHNNYSEREAVRRLELFSKADDMRTGIEDTLAMLDEAESIFENAIEPLDEEDADTFLRAMDNLRRSIETLEGVK